MDDLRVLTTRKRALIAVIHSVVFLAIAAHGFVAPKAGIVHRGTTADVALLMIYLIVTSILFWLAAISRCARERIYFGLCTCSASFGVLRTIFGDASLPIAQYMRVAMLTSAVAVGAIILISYCRALPATVASD